MRISCICHSWFFVRLTFSGSEDPGFMYFVGNAIELRLFFDSLFTRGTNTNRVERLTEDGLIFFGWFTCRGVFPLLELLLHVWFYKEHNLLEIP